MSGPSRGLCDRARPLAMVRHDRRPSSRPLYIGGVPGADLFDGKVQDVRLYNRPLSPAEVQQLSAGGHVGVRIIKWVEIQ